jgi:outer membrane protein assembly factor BamC
MIMRRLIMKRVGRGAWALLFSGSLVVVAACGILPDRTKEYQYSHEIPPLEVPPDLSRSAIDQASAEAERRTAQASSRGTEVETEEAGSSRESEVPQSEQLPRGEDMPSHLVVNDPYPIAWRLVGKALARMNVEITDRDRSTGYYYILYQVPEEEQSIWSALAFWRGDEPVEEAYRIKLEDNEGKTEVFVLDDTGTPQSQGTALELLKQMHEQIKAEPRESKG